MKYLILQNPGHNRVYYDQSEKLAIAELKIALNYLSVVCLSVEAVDLAGVRYIQLEVKEKLHRKDIRLLSGLSFVFAIYEFNGEALFPIEKNHVYLLPEKLSSIQKYQGKTNELFTRMMMSVAVLSSDFYGKSNLRVLDPVCGRGTGLFEAAIKGYHAFGIDKDRKSIAECANFFRAFLKKERYKHEYKQRPVAGKNKKEAVQMHDFSYAYNKERFQEIATRKQMGVVEGDTLMAASYFKAESFHVIVGDLPYGIMHGNKDKNKAKGKTRNPSEMLVDCLPQWHTLLKKGGSIVMAWNSFLLPYKRMVDLFQEAGFDVLCEGAYVDFEHRVDQSIKRNIIVATKK